MSFSAEGIPFDDWKEPLKQSQDKMSIKAFTEKMLSLNLSNSILVDCTANEEVASCYEEVLRSSISVVTPNKYANADTYERYLQLKESAKKGNVKFFYETNVGAGLPVISTIEDLVSSGDQVIKIEAVLSGTLSFIFNSLTPDLKFSDVVKEAKELGYTEPDPREDLSGMDVARKLLILAREIGVPLEASALEVESLVPKDSGEAGDLESLFTALEKADEEFGKKQREAAEKGQVLRYIGTYEEGKAAVSVIPVGPEHPFYSLSGTDNILSFVTKRYSETPLVIKGPGAGIDVTAAGVFADIMRVASYL